MNSPKKLLLTLTLFIAPFLMAQAESAKDGNPSTVYVAVKDFPKTDGGEVPYQVPGKEKWRQVLSINAGNPAYRDKFARAERVFEGATGSYDVTITTLTEFDGECVYRILVDGKVVGSFTNPRVGDEGDFKHHKHTWKKVALKQGSKLAIESNTASNDLIPEGDGFAWARGRWSQIELSLSAK